jgi:hypothetical protein
LSKLEEPEDSVKLPVVPVWIKESPDFIRILPLDSDPWPLDSVIAPPRVFVDDPENKNIPPPPTLPPPIPALRLIDPPFPCKVLPEESDIEPVSPTKDVPEMNSIFPFQEYFSYCFKM